MSTKEPEAHAPQSGGVPTRSPGLNVPWPALSLGLVILTITSLGTLAVVVSINDVDLLSTIALALAVLAFAAQIIISLAQAQSVAQQLSQSERINTETRGLLSTITAQSAALLSNQSEQFNRVLDAALGGDALRAAVSAASTEVLDLNSEGTAASAPPVIDTAELRSNIEDSLREAFKSVNSERPQTARRVQVRPEHRRFVELLTTYPPESEGREAFNVLATLTPWETAVFARMVKSDVDRAQRGRDPYALALTDAAGELGPINKTLVRKGLVSFEKAEEGKPGEGTVMRRTLTPLGVTTGRLIHPTSVPPAWLRQLHEEAGRASEA